MSHALQFNHTIHAAQVATNLKFQEISNVVCSTTELWWGTLNKNKLKKVNHYTFTFLLK